MSAKPQPGHALFLKICAQHGLREIVAEHRFHPTRKWRLDYALVKEKVALEVEGGAYIGGRHTRGAGFVKDLEKYNELARMGWRLARVLPSQLPLMSTIQLLLDLKALGARDSLSGGRDE